MSVETTFDMFYFFKSTLCQLRFKKNYVSWNFIDHSLITYET